MPSLRYAGLAAAGLAAVLSASACSDHPGTAAIVGGTTISQSTVDKYVTDAQRNATFKKSYDDGKVTGYKQEVVGRLVNHQLLHAAVRQEGLQVTNADRQAATDLFIQQVEQSQQATLNAKDLPKLADENGIPKDRFAQWIGDQAYQYVLIRHLGQDADTSDAALRQYFDQAGGSQQGLKFEDYRDKIADTIRYQAGQARYAKFMQGLTRKQKVKVNPRYGTFDPVRGSFSGTDPLVGQEKASPSPAAVPQQ
ncbi:MAG: SurA N-terminal domain-containing protein [Mycobacteriales bacterium]